MKKSHLLLICTLLLFTVFFASCIEDKNASQNLTSSDSNTVTPQEGSQAHIHSFSDWTIVKKATCTENGSKERVCSCSEKETETIKATGHTFSNWETSIEATCTKNGSKERVCSCGEKETETIKATGHTFSNWETSIEATCTENGSKERVCSCGEKEIETIKAKGHNFGSWKTTKKATCTAKGLKERTCSCGYSESQNISGEHLWKSATCSSPATCSTCGKTQGTKLEHNYVSGKCTRCGQSNIVITNTYGSGRQFIKTYWEYSTGRIKPEAEGYIESFSVKDGEIEIKVSIVRSGTLLIKYKIVDSEGITVQNSYDCQSNCLAGETYRLKFYPLLQPGEYKITFQTNNNMLN